MTLAATMAAFGAPIHDAMRANDRERVAAILTADPSQVWATDALLAPPLCWAMEARLPDVVQLLLDKGADPNYSGVTGLTALHTAVQQGNIDMVRLLLARGASPNARSASGETPLHLAVAANHVVLVSLLLEKGASPNLRDSEGRSPLHLAAKQGVVAVMDTLIADKALVDLPDAAGATPLTRAIEGQTLTPVAWLVDHGAQTGVPDNVGRTPAHAAVLAGNVENARRIAVAGASLALRDDEGRTPLDLAVIGDRQPILQALLPVASPRALNSSDHMGETVLGRATAKGLISVVEDMLARGARADTATLKGVTSLMQASAQTDGKLAQMLLARGATADAVARNGETALFVACRDGRETAATALLARRVPLAADRLGRSPLHVAKTKATVTALTAAGADPRATDRLRLSVAHEWLALPRGADPRDALEALLDAGGDPNAAGPDGRTLLHYCAVNGYAQSAELLLRRGVRADVRDSQGYLPVHLLSTGEMVKVFAAHRIAVNGVDPSGSTLLHRAGADAAFTDALLAAGADPRATDGLGRTPLHLARNANVAKALLAAGADVNARDSFGMTPLGLAARVPVCPDDVRATLRQSGGSL